MSKIFMAMLIIMLIFMLICKDVKNAEKKQSKKTEIMMDGINNQIGMPNIHNFFEKKMAKQIFELRDKSDLITHAYMKNLEGKFIYLGKCIGFGLPYSVQYTNPNKITIEWGETVATPQADPNGLYTPEGLSATWLMLINEKSGDPEIIYCEPEIIVTQSKLPRRLIESWSLTNEY